MMIRFLAFAVLLLAVSARAQIQIGTVKGGITDPAGAVVTGASVWLTNSLEFRLQAVLQFGVPPSGGLALQCKLTA
jgi:hypothetical protein